MMGHPWGLAPGAGPVLWREGLPWGLGSGATYGPVELVLEVFIDHVKFTVICKSVYFLLGKERKKKKAMGREQCWTNLVLVRGQQTAPCPALTGRPVHVPKATLPTSSPSIPPTLAPCPPAPRASPHALSSVWGAPSPPPVPQLPPTYPVGFGSGFLTAPSPSPSQVPPCSTPLKGGCKCLCLLGQRLFLQTQDSWRAGPCPAVLASAVGLGTGWTLPRTAQTSLGGLSMGKPCF